MESSMIFVGDIHGDWEWFKEYCENIPNDVNVVQVGDFGVGFKPSQDHEDMKQWMKSNPNVRFIRGNHDNPHKVEDFGDSYIPDGHIEVINGRKIMYIGGAFSIDSSLRTQGVDWWPEEECSIPKFMDLLDVYKVEKPDIMVTHDCPEEIAVKMFIETGQSLFPGKKIGTRTGQALQRFFEYHDPDLWVFGHWHVTKQYKFANTTFVCVGEKDVVGGSIK